MKDNTTLIIILIAVFWWMSRNKETQPINQISNAEVWKWIDYKGNDRSITISRDVHVS